jgi:adenylate cyclase
VGTEIERKFLVSGDAWRAELPPGQEGSLIRQGYLLRDAARTVRVRRSGDRGWLTIKGPGTLARAEYEYEIPVADADELLADLCEPGIIDKTRYRIPVGDLEWEVDEFHGRHEGLIVAEVELLDLATEAELPRWAGREVTDDPAYTNAALSRPDAPSPPR